MTAQPSPRAEPIELRPLRDGEWVEFDELGVPGVQLSGPGVKAAVHEDGSTSACMIPDTVLRDLEIFVFASIILDTAFRIGRRELHFLRTVAGLSPEALAETSGLPSGKLAQVEGGGSSLSRSEEDQLRGSLLPEMVKRLGELSPHIRELNRSHIEKAQEVLTSHSAASVTGREAQTDSGFLALPRPGASALLGEGTRARYVKT